MLPHKAPNPPTPPHPPPTQVDNVDVVAHAGAVAGVVVGAVDGQHGAVPQRHRLHPRHQVVQHHLVLADASCRKGAGKGGEGEQD